MRYTQVAGGSKSGQSIEHLGTCDLCEATQQVDLYDASVHVGSRFIWAWTCPSCFNERGGKLGIGQGQHYTKDPRS